MKILGINETSHHASVSLISDGKILFAREQGEFIEKFIEVQP